MRAIAILLGLGFVWVQAQIWWGKQSASHVAELRVALKAQEAQNQATRQQLVRLRAELKDLREGLEMVEEKARGELGMVKPDEIFVRLQ
ncbi:MAG: septum formation initiator family protein [Inhella sp.]|uniref:septum formation initiator family protein n=1 Tax=Inhella sp. TaxID=1921806 RepID=UPI0022BE1D73|nr:septum formation initiator family protein [Inhella sp.]MCZ8236314.1 septum formation initiator family protein [Inhella sp.]